ncbi:hypothetical protein ABW21_db0208977 [Orbilia brochopaga]|nr:hypothetical protein ABW21_db0208977 [Drechslerella brochopaga]
MPPAVRTHALIFVGTPGTDVNGAYNLYTAVKSCFSRSIIPHVCSNYDRITLFNLLCPQPSGQPSGLDGDADRSRSSVRLDPVFFPPAPLDMPSRADVKDLLEIIRPYYWWSIESPSSKHELPRAVKKVVSKLTSGDTLLVILIAQGVHSSGCLLSGRPITNQELWSDLEQIPVKCTAMLTIIATGFDDRRTRASIFHPKRDYCGPPEPAPAPGTDLFPEDKPDLPFGKELYMVARMEVVKAIKQKTAEHEVIRVRDWGTRVSTTDILAGFYPLRLAPWSYSAKDWDLVDSVPQAFEKTLDQYIVIPRSEHPIINKLVSKLSIAKRIRRQAMLYLPFHYLERKLLEMPRDGSSTLNLEGTMKRIIEQSKKQSLFGSSNAKTFLYQPRVEETLRWLEEQDLRVELFIQTAYKSGAFHRIAVLDKEIDPVTQKGMMQFFARKNGPFESLILPPKDSECIQIEYYTQAYKLAWLIEVHRRSYDWFNVEKFLDYVRWSL